MNENPMLHNAEVLNPTSNAAAIARFDKRQGGNGVRHNEWMIYPNGAMRETGSPWGALIEPPEDNYQRLSNIVLYYQARLANAVKQFDDLKHLLMMGDGSNPEGLDQLRQFREAVSVANAAVENAKQALAATPKGKQLEANRQYDAELRQRQQSFKDKIKAVRI